MIRWAVDTTGIDIDADLQCEDTKLQYFQNSLHAEKYNWKEVGVDLGPLDVATINYGQVHVLTEGEMYERVLDGGELVLFPQTGRCSAVGSASVGLHRTLGSVSGVPIDEEVETRARDIRVFCNFLNLGKRSAFTVTMRQPTFRGVEVVNATLQSVIAADERLSSMYSLNPRHYKCYFADEYTGEEEAAIQLDTMCHKFDCFSLQPLPQAKLFLFPQRTALLPPLSEDLILVVEVRPLDPQAKIFKRSVSAPADMLAESLEQTIVSRLPNNGIVQGSLRIKYGPCELNINEYYNFGAGCGQMDTPIAERTILSLHRFGVTEVVVQGRNLEEDAEVQGDVGEHPEKIVVRLTEEEAMAFSQFEIIRINRYGARQQRVLCIDSERLYTMRPTADPSPQNVERLIEDIEVIREFPKYPKTFAIEYKRASKYEPDHFECATTYNCAFLIEKLRVLKVLAEKKEPKKVDRPLVRLLTRLGFGY